MDIDAFRAFCASLPGTSEALKWEDHLCFRVADKMYFVLPLQEDGPFTASLKVNDEEFDELCATPDIVPAPYLGRFKWVQVQHPDRFSPTEWQQRLRTSYELIKRKLPRQVREGLEVATPSAR